jgi:hypothetical protein
VVGMPASVNQNQPLPKEKKSYVVVIGCLVDTGDVSSHKKVQQISSDMRQCFYIIKKIRRPLPFIFLPHSLRPLTLTKYIKKY